MSNDLQAELIRICHILLEEAERPALEPRIERMRALLADALAILEAARAGPGPREAAPAA
jgi:2C-methyl-D-erythritol 2,4-cyclodiphosphate synthase